nr:MAG TPA: hypothetical protein [Bacteriophage sp.]
MQAYHSNSNHKLHIILKVIYHNQLFINFF